MRSIAPAQLLQVALCILAGLAVPAPALRHEANAALDDGKSPAELAAEIRFERATARATAESNDSQERQAKYTENAQIGVQASTVSAIKVANDNLEKTKELSRKQVDKVREMEQAKTRVAEAEADSLRNSLKAAVQKVQAHFDMKAAHEKTVAYKTQMAAAEKKHAATEAWKLAKVRFEAEKTKYNSAAAKLDGALTKVSASHTNELSSVLTSAQGEAMVARTAMQAAQHELAEAQTKMVTAMAAAAAHPASNY